MTELLKHVAFQNHLMDIESHVVEHHLTWCSDEYPMIEILDWKGRNTLAFFEFTTFDDLDQRLEKLSK